MAIRKCTVADLQDIMKALASYYRYTDLYLELSDTTDAYQWYIDRYTEATKQIVEMGMSYKQNGNYLLSIPAKVVKEKNPWLYDECFEAIYGMKEWIEREVNDVIFITAIGPKGGHLNLDTYKLFDYACSNAGNSTILTDAFASNFECDEFAKHSDFKRVVIVGHPYFRYGLKR